MFSHFHTLLPTTWTTEVHNKFQKSFSWTCSLTCFSGWRILSIWTFLRRTSPRSWSFCFTCCFMDLILSSWTLFARFCSDICTERSSWGSAERVSMIEVWISFPPGSLRSFHLDFRHDFSGLHLSYFFFAFLSKCCNNTFAWRVKWIVRYLKNEKIQILLKELDLNNYVLNKKEKKKTEDFFWIFFWKNASFGTFSTACEWNSRDMFSESWLQRNRGWAAGCNYLCDRESPS